ncbi:MAG: hypothetical protein JSS14_27485 [Proteobacteria bacterium]|nr:hypothetical protein [Pseudomonadota bacterium]
MNGNAQEKTHSSARVLVVGAVLVLLATDAAMAAAGSTRTSVNRSASVNHASDINRTTNVNVNRNVNVDVDADRNWHPVATAAVTTAAVATTAAVIGSVTRTLPPACVPVQMGAVVYQQCGGAYYQPQYVGTTVQYVVVSPP